MNRATIHPQLETNSKYIGKKYEERRANIAPPGSLCFGRQRLQGRMEQARRVVQRRHPGWHLRARKWRLWRIMAASGLNFMWVVRRSNKDYCQTTWSGEGEHGGATGQAVWSAASEEEEITRGEWKRKPSAVIFLGSIDMCVRSGRDGRSANLGWGEQRSVDRVMHAHRRSGFNFPTALRAFISSRDDNPK
jgi:hypothetical protein